MKKTLVGILVLLASLSYSQRLEYNEEIIDQLLDASPTSITSDSIHIGAWDKIAFAVKYDETEVGGGVSAVLTVEIGDGDTWFDYDILFDKNGTDGPSANIAFTADDEYFFYLPPGVTGQWLRVTVTGTGTDADDLVQINVTMFMQKF